MIDATPALRAYAAWRRAALEAEDPARAQARVLAGLVRRARETAFGRAHGFARIGSVRDYQRAVPLRRHEAMWEEWLRRPFPVLRDVAWPGTIPFFAESSGTTAARSKFLPVSWAMVAANRRAALDTLVHHVACRPRSRVLGGTTLMLGGSTDLRRLAPGVRSGDLSGIAAATMPRWAAARTFPPRAIALLADWDRKLDAIARGAGDRPIVAITGTTSWLLVLFERLAAQRQAAPPLLAALVPELELLVHGGTGFAPYAPRFAAWLQGSGARLAEVYPASEGFIAMADGSGEAGMRALADNGLFLEFVPRDEVDAARPARFWAADVEPGQDYALVLSSNAGLWAAVLGDVVRVTSRRPLRLTVSGRLAHELSLFGEHVSGAEIDRAVAQAAHATGVRLVDHAALPAFEAGAGGRGRHHFAVEADGPFDADVLAAAIDAALSAGNADYAAHRAGNVQLLPPRVHAVPQGGFTRWMRARGRVGGQNKVPRVLPDWESFAALRELPESLDRPS